MFLSLRLGRLTVGAPTLLPVAMLFVLACSRTPAVQLGRDTFQSKVTSESQGQIALVDFTKTNGVQREIAGQRMYTMEFTSTLRFTAGGWKGGDALAGYFSTFAVMPGQPGGWAGFGQNWKYFERNAELQVSGEIQFESMEKGWRPTAVEVKKVVVRSNRPDEQYYDHFVGLWANRNPEGSDLKILKDRSRYKLIDQTYNSETDLTAESRALTFRELDMPVYMHLDETGKLLRMGENTYDRIADEAAHHKSRSVPSTSGTPATSLASPSSAPHDGDVFKLQAVIRDPDGYTNVRAAASNAAPVVSVVRNGEVFLTFRQQGDWWQVKLASGKTGYMHRSRINMRE